MYALLKQTDATIGRISQAIRRKGMWDDSLVVLASDNGTAAPALTLTPTLSLTLTPFPLTTDH